MYSSPPVRPLYQRCHMFFLNITIDSRLIACCSIPRSFLRNYDRIMLITFPTCDTIIRESDSDVGRKNITVSDIEQSISAISGLHDTYILNFALPSVMTLASNIVPVFGPPKTGLFSFFTHPCALS